MRTRMTAYFENGDMAELALSHLRRAGINFTLNRPAGLLKSRTEYDQWITSASAFPYTSSSDKSGGAELKLSLNSGQADWAAEILRRDGGTNITARF